MTQVYAPMRCGESLTPQGAIAHLYLLRNSRGMEARIMTYGGIVTSLKTPDRRGEFADVVLGFEQMDEYFDPNPYFGALIGRYCNRIGGAQFQLDGKLYALSKNDGPNSLHGGNIGFDKVLWSVHAAEASTDGPRLTLTYRSPDGEGGYPGNLFINAAYTLSGDNALRLDYLATTDRPTVVNLTQHSYFNLRGAGDVLGHIVYIDANRFTPIDRTLIPTGELRSVLGTPFDFREPCAIGTRVGIEDEQLQFAGGFDHNWVTNLPAGELGLRAMMYESGTGRLLHVLSTQPGLQFYSGNFLDGSLVGKRGLVYAHRSGVCFEPQHFPDSPNRPTFPSTVLRPGEVYANTIIYRFSVRP